ncbi:MAG: glutathione peroxidase [Bacteroidia bacterium]|nr:glutathione peroxidase [Bacteroidia bacterium]
MLLNFISFPALFKGQATSTIYSFTANNIGGQPVSFESFKGKKLLLVNTASKCGLTPQYEQLEELYKEYKDKGLVIIGFPSNDFAHQEPGNNKDIAEFCVRNYGVSFLMMEKISVKGDSIHPIYEWLTSKKLNGVLNSQVKWNFQKYLINEKGELVDMVSPIKKPNCRKIIRWLNKA